MSTAQTVDIIDHFTERTSPRTNHLFPVQRQMESALNRFLFSMVKVPSRDLEGWRQEDWMIRLVIWQKVMMCDGPHKYTDVITIILENSDSLPGLMSTVAILSLLSPPTIQPEDIQHLINNDVNHISSHSSISGLRFLRCTSSCENGLQVHIVNLWNEMLLYQLTDDINFNFPGCIRPRQAWCK